VGRRLNARSRERVRRVAHGYVATMTLAVIAGIICILLLILGFLAPRLSTKPQRGVNRAFSAGGNTAAKAPGGAGRWLRKPFDASNRAANKSASAGRRGRSKMPM
jgi:Family of unknown function (DUF6411)